MVFTNRNEDGKGYGVLSITHNDPSDFQATIHYTPLSLGSPFDDFDVNEAVEVVVVPYEDTHYAFVAGHNYRALGLGLPGWNGKGNIGIIKDALSDNPQLVAGTRSLPEAQVNGVALSGDGKALYAAYPGLESTFVFDVEQMLATASNPSHWEDLRSQPIEELNPNIFLAGRLKTTENPITGERRYEVDPDDPLAPITTDGEDYSLTVASTVDVVSLNAAPGDSLFSSLVQLDNLLKPNSDAEQGALFDSPLHFIGFSRGTVVNSEIVQRLGTYFPNAGGKIGSSVRDLQMTTLDPHDFNQPSLRLLDLDFSDFREPKVQVWENVTFADNYYQTVPELEGMTFTPGGRDIPRLPTTETIDPAGLKFPRQGWANWNPDPNAPLLGEPDVSIQLGTRQGEEGYEDGRVGFTRETDPLFGFGGTHTRVPNWYAGTADLFPTHFPFDSESDEGALFRRRGDGYYDHLYDEAFPHVSPWYSPDHLGSEFAHGEESAPWEGIGTGWFYSVLGGGAALDLRPSSDVERVPVAFDNTYDAPMRGDFAVPTLFNGNFDAVFQPKDGFRNLISDAVPGWSFHNGGNRVSTSQLVDLKAEAVRDDLLAEHLQKVGNNPSSDGYQMDYALKLGDGNKITHNRFVVPDWGVLRFDLYAPEPNGGEVKVTVKGDSSSKTETIFLEPASNAKSYNAADKYRIGYGNQGFETFHVEIPQELRGKVATLEFDVEGSTQVLLDDVFFKSQHLLLGNPTLNHRIAGQDKNNFLIERPQYSASYNESDKGANWVSWHTNKAWLGDLKREETSDRWRIDPFLRNAGINSVKSSDYTDPARSFDRGHVMARELRNRTPKDQLATYFTSNLLPHEGRIY